MDKRRFLSQLPVIHQTESLKKFFGSTVDHVFQPGKAEQVSGYIGQHPAYTKPEKDFYVPEPDAVRREHQLEPVMITVDPDSGATTRLLFYDDLVNYLRAARGKTTDPNRLFDGDRYAWCPPVDPDKLLNFPQYRWFGDDPSAFPAVELVAPSTATTADGTRAAFPLPPKLDAALATQEEAMAFVDGLRVPLAALAADTVTLRAAPPAGSKVEVFRYGDLRRLILGQTAFDAAAFNSQGVSLLSNDMRVMLVDGVARAAGYDGQPLDAVANDDPMGRWMVPLWDTTGFDNGVREIPWDEPEVVNDFLVKGVGRAIELVPYDAHPDLPVEEPIHVVIDRRSRDGNPWSRVNYWVHHEALAWTGEKFLSRAATRPIVEFLPNLELWNYGTRRLPDVVARIDGPLLLSPEPLTALPTPDDPRWSTFTEIDIRALDGHLPGTVFLPGWRVLRPGDRLLVTDHADAAYRHRIFTIGTRLEHRDIEVREVMRLVAAPTPRLDDILRLRQRGPQPYEDKALDRAQWEFNTHAVEYRFDGKRWVEAQGYDGRSDPLFSLYTADGVRHDALPGSRFAGNRLFGYAAGSGALDPVLNRALNYDQFDEIVFENDQVTRATAFADGTSVEGYQFCRVVGAFAPGITIDLTTVQLDDIEHDVSTDAIGARLEPDRFLNGWYPQGTWEQVLRELGITIDLTTIYLDDTRNDISLDDGTDDKKRFVARRPQQTLDAATGVWSMPNPLVANPDHDQPTFLSRCQWFDHFVTLLEAQPGFTGRSIAANNWRDTKRDLSLGTRIVDHRWPLPKTMLLASDRMFDLPDGIRFVEQEYLRFRTKFVRQVVELHQNGALGEDDDPDLWVDRALTNLKVAKNEESPFFLSPMAGGGWFIPPTPTALGVFAPVEPGYVLDDSYAKGQTVRLLRGHDGSLTLPFGDIRDTVLLALERRLWANLPETFRTDAPVVDLFDLVPGRYRQGRYSRSEVNDLLAMSFRRWATRSGFDYQTYEGYDVGNPFTWNYHDVPDRDGTPMPGHWRAIYRWYFDTDRPHAAPWEMLGFAAEPDWWVAVYGPAPYTRDNAKLWAHLEEGRIVAGPRQGIDARFARPGLMDVLPVDVDGTLLDPLAARIILTAPTQKQATRRWAIGDHGPVENVWRMSPAFGFAQALLAFLTRPSQFVEEGWDTINRKMLADGQFIHAAAGCRPRAASLRVHGEADEDGVPQGVVGIQQFVVEPMIYRAQDPAILGKAVRGLAVRLGHKMAGFTSADNLRVFTDNFGLVPQEDTQVVLHRSPPIREAIYAGLIIEWTGDGYRIIGYDEWGTSIDWDTIRRGGGTLTDPWSHGTITIIPPDRASAKRTVRLGEDLVINEWRGNVFYQVNTFVEHEQSIYRCLRSHTSGTAFEDDFWKAEPNVRRPQAYTVVLYDRGEDAIERIENGVVVTTIQEVVDILLSYERWLIKEGFVFDHVDPETGIVLDWTAAMKEFLLWAQQKWEPGNFIALSPGASMLKFRTDHGYVLNLEDWVNGGYGMVDRTARPIPRKNTFVTRLDEETKIVTISDDLFGACLRIGEIEHVLVFSNTTIFNDILYQPLYDLRQPRLRLIGQRTQPWAGRLDAPGYMVDDNRLLPNFERAAEDIRDMFEVERADRRVLRDHARHVIGYQSRPYLNNLLISETQQFEFYQGMIQSKGAPGVFNKLSRSEFIEQQRDLRFLEEWAIQMGRYGAVGLRREIAFVLERDDIRNNPQYIEFATDDPYDTTVGVPLDSDRWVARPEQAEVFPYVTARPADGTLAENGPLPTPGPVRVDEVDFTVFRDEQLNVLYRALQDEGRALADGQRVWTYEHDLTGWNVLRATALGLNGAGDNTLFLIETSSENETLAPGVIRVYFTGTLDVTEADVGRYCALDGDTSTTPDAQGFLKIVGFFSGCGGEDCHDFLDLDIADRLAASKENVGFDFTKDDTVVPPRAYVLRPMRFADRDALDAFQALHPLPVGELAYLDDGGLDDTPRWLVLAKDTTTWAEHRRQPDKIDSARIASALLHATATRITARTLSPEPLVLDRLVVLDPVLGLIPGVADREITYKLDTDPACYAGQGRWGAPQVGQLWWDFATVRFLETELDVLAIDPTIHIDSTRVHLDDREHGVGYPLDLYTPARRQREIDYRNRYWGKLAPGSSVDLYEWTRSTTSPVEIEGAVTDRFLTTEEFDDRTGQMVTVHYFWLRNPRTVPSLPERHLSAVQIATILTDIAETDLPWLAPITPSGLLVGGIEQHLTHDTVLRVRLLDADHADAVIHEEWSLVRQNDERGALPAAWLWQALRDSLVGFDDFHRPVPDPTLSARAQVGLSLRPRKSLFAPRDHEDARAAMLTARRGYVQVINTLLAGMNLFFDQPNVLSLLTTADALPTRHLLWARPEDTTRIDYPLAASYDHLVETLDERDALLTTPAFQAALSAARAGATVDRPRVLVVNPTAARPSWSIWTLADADTLADLPDAALVDPERVFVLATAYDQTVVTRADLDDLDDLDAPTGTRVLVQADEDRGGFWSIWRKAATGFVLEQAQSHRVQDFWSFADWFEDGYSADEPPVVRYASIAARTQASLPTPEATYVRVDDDGSGRWIWCVHEDGKWRTVARQNGTLQLSARLYDPATVAGWGVDRFDKPATRDGSFELRAIFDILRENVLDDAQNIEVFFAMLDLVHAQQDHVGWAFKTSFLSVAGYNTRLDQSPVQVYDNTENLLDYIEEVKPYRVKTRTVIQSMSPDIDVADLGCTDFDKPPYYDAKRDTYRSLDPADAGDHAILETLPWSHWLSHAGQNMDESPIRHLAMTIQIDRCSPSADWNGWDATGFGAPWDRLERNPTAIDRMLASYEPSEGMRTITEVMKLGFRGDLVLDGGRLHATTITRLPDDTVFGELAVGWGRFAFERAWPFESAASDYVLIGTKLWCVDPTIKDGLTVVVTDAQGRTLHTYTGVLDDEVRCIELEQFWAPERLQVHRDSVITVDGGDFAANAVLDWHLNPATLPAHGLRDPHHATNHPEELVPAGVADALTITVCRNWNLGAPLQCRTVERFQADDTDATVAFLGIPQSANAVSVYRDGVRADPNDYLIDGFAGIEVPLLDGAHHATTVVVHTFGTAGLTVLTEQRLYDAKPEQRYRLDAEPRGEVEVLVDGVRLPPARVTVEGREVVLPADTAGDVVMINVRAPWYRGVLDDTVRHVELGRDWSVDSLRLWLDGTRLTPRIIRLAADIDLAELGVGWEHFAFDMAWPFETEGSSYVLVGTRLYCLDPKVKGEIVVVVHEDAIASSSATIVRRDRLPLDVSVPVDARHVWTLPEGVQTTLVPRPEHVGTIAEVEGKRLMPPRTYHGVLDAGVRFVEIERKWSAGSVHLWLDDRAITPALVRLADDARPEQLQVGWGRFAFGRAWPFESSGSDWVLIGTRLWCLNRDIVGEVMVVVDEESDYTVTPRVGADQVARLELAVVKPLGVSGYDEKGWSTLPFDHLPSPDPDLRVEATTFRNADLMGIRTYTFDGRLDGAYPLVEPPATPDHVTVTRNGYFLLPGDDYRIETRFRDGRPCPFLIVNESRPGQRLVVMVYSGAPARAPTCWAAHTARSGLARWGDALPCGNYDVGPLDHDVGAMFDDLLTRDDLVAQGVRPLHAMQGGWEWQLQPRAACGWLAADLLPDSATITLLLNPFGEAHDLVPPQPLPLPDRDSGTPGVVWIGGERIEYFGHARQDDTVTLSGLRRGTRGTHVAAEQRRVTIDQGTGTKRRFTFAALDPNRIEVTLTLGDGTRIGQQVGVDFTVETSDGDVVVVMSRAPLASERLVIAETAGACHPAGTLAHGDGTAHAAPMPLLCGG